MKGSASILLAILSTLHFSCSGSLDSIQDNTVNIELTGYIQTCQWEPMLFVKEQGGWRQASKPVPPWGPYYLDDKLIPYGYCDVVQCVKVDKPLRISLVEYFEVGMKEVPSDSKRYSWLLHKYKTVPLRGEIRFQCSYFADSTCGEGEEKTFTQIINR